ncbi:uncharacterized protein B0I36DRAFT_329912 [Microdochium trichocladiopsis]|uniref:Uncharacterized protein n=1 Tax=Microdochium trichocladiopsis TaxID=1682393 RepID=A0A9P8XZS6_9PEZI|nr:uncharacterized protein B0I36DRAFT_329912 [Microdochium trichocladiopsis]KAH7026118.1 hypothetical protein B0I36DRAFT_329912 [Microdochium trichocladiopsis]
MAAKQRSLARLARLRLPVDTIGAGGAADAGGAAFDPGPSHITLHGPSSSCLAHARSCRFYSNSVPSDSSHSLSVRDPPATLQTATLLTPGSPTKPSLNPFQPLPPPLSRLLWHRGIPIYKSLPRGRGSDGATQTPFSAAHPRAQPSCLSRGGHPNAVRHLGLPTHPPVEDLAALPP